MDSKFLGLELFRVSCHGVGLMSGIELKRALNFRVLRGFEFCASQNALELCQNLCPGSIGHIYCNLDFRPRPLSRVRCPIQLYLKFKFLTILNLERALMLFLGLTLDSIGYWSF